MDFYYRHELCSVRCANGNQINTVIKIDRCDSTYKFSNSTVSCLTELLLLKIKDVPGRKIIGYLKRM